MIKHQFSDTPIEGFVSTLLFTKRRVTFTVGCPVIQIVHIHGNHWIVATTDGITKKFYIYDSLYLKCKHLYTIIDRRKFWNGSY